VLLLDVLVREGGVLTVPLLELVLRVGVVALLLDVLERVVLLGAV
jgi:hypothetical protein